MTAPSDAARFFLSALAIGAVLGALYGLLRPLRRRFGCLADALFVLIVFVGWIELAFGVCAGDIRLGYTMGLAVGAIAWEMSIGKLLRGAAETFWKIVLWPAKKFFAILRKIYNFLLAIPKKSVTIKYNTEKCGGGDRGKEEKDQAGAAQDQSHHKGRHSGRGGAVRHRAAGAVQRH